VCLAEHAFAVAMRGVSGLAKVNLG
jgi:hypothetical protein